MKPIPQTPQGRQQAAYFTWTDASGAIQTFVPDLVESEEWSGGASVTENPVEQGANVTDNVRATLRKCTLKIFATNTPIGSSQWADADREPVALELPSYTFAPFDGLINAPDWNSNLQARVLAGAGAGLIGGAVGGAIGGAAGGVVAGAVASAGSALAGSLLAGEEVDRLIQTNAGLLPPPAPPPVQATVQGFGDDEGDFVLQTIQLLEQLVATSQTVDLIGTKTSCIGTTPGLGGMAIESLTHVRGSGEGVGATITIGFKEIRVATTQTVPAPAPTLPRATKPVNKGNQQTSDGSDAAADAANAAVAGYKQGRADIADLLGSDGGS